MEDSKDPPETSGELPSESSEAADPGSSTAAPEPGFLYSDGMNGGTGVLFIPSWDVYPRRKRSKKSPKPYKKQIKGTTTDVST